MYCNDITTSTDCCDGLAICLQPGIRAGVGPYWPGGRRISIEFPLCFGLLTLAVTALMSEWRLTGEHR